jgi:hypothetical protein
MNRSDRIVLIALIPIGLCLIFPWIFYAAFLIFGDGYSALEIMGKWVNGKP